MKAIIDLDPQTYSRHAIHGEECVWSETNCYVDVLVELIHALGFNPVAGLPFSLNIDFEGDQWTFFKYPLGDLLDLYGFDVQELNPWNDLAQHVQQQVSRGNPVLVELDSYFLPDTAGSAYKQEHVKSTVAVIDIDVERKHMGYFHGQGFYHLDGEDFDDIFQIQGLVHERMLPPYIELVKLRGCTQETPETLEKSLVILRRQLGLMPEENPFYKFKQQLEQDLPALLEAGMDTFHKYSFATFRQFGACYELAATYLRWLEVNNETGLTEAAAAYQNIAESVKAIQFQFARSIARKKPLDISALETMAKHWQLGKHTLLKHYS